MVSGMVVGGESLESGLGNFPGSGNRSVPEERVH